MRIAVAIEIVISITAMNTITIISLLFAWVFATPFLITVTAIKGHSIARILSLSRSDSHITTYSSLAKRSPGFQV
jgi:hypothetical protein